MVMIKESLLKEEAAAGCVLPDACNLIKKETMAHVLSFEFCEISKNTFLAEYLWG